jgi:hypothetical protein
LSGGAFAAPGLHRNAQVPQRPLPMLTREGMKLVPSILMKLHDTEMKGKPAS